MITKGQAKAAERKALLEARRAYHLIPTSVAVVRGPEGWFIKIGLPRDPGNLSRLVNVDGVPVEVDIVGSATLLSHSY